jgi:hypothetical protein
MMLPSSRSGLAFALDGVVKISCRDLIIEARFRMKVIYILKGLFEGFRSLAPTVDTRHPLAPWHEFLEDNILGSR